jgi:hypothetical protein
MRTLGGILAVAAALAFLAGFFLNRGYRSGVKDGYKVGLKDGSKIAALAADHGQMDEKASQQGKGTIWREET